MSKVVRVIASSVSPSFRASGETKMSFSGLREQVLRIAPDKPDFLCFPEMCACLAPTIKEGVKNAVEVEPYAAEIGKIAREVNCALIVPMIERYQGRVYNSVPIVDRSGKLVMVYRKNFPTIGEMEEGISPGWEVPVAECDGVRVGAAVCFDANFPEVAAELERQRARLVFWPTMFWGGSLLSHWALRYGFFMVAAYGVESAIVDMSGKFLAQQGQWTFQVQSKRLLPWAVAEVNVDREIFHLNENQNKFLAMRDKYGTGIEIEMHQPEGFVILASRMPDKTIEQVSQEFELETLRDYLARAYHVRNE